MSSKVKKALKAQINEIKIWHKIVIYVLWSKFVILANVRFVFRTEGEDYNHMSERINFHQKTYSFFHSKVTESIFSLCTDALKVQGMKNPFYVEEIVRIISMRS